MSSETVDFKITPTKTATGTPRKAPQCKTCHQPRLGHPRVCPQAESMTAASPSATTRAVESGCDELPVTLDPLESTVGAMRKLRIMSPQGSPTPVGKPAEQSRRRSSVKPRIVSEDSLATISTFSGEILNDISKPGVLDDNIVKEEEESRNASVERWRDSTPKKREIKKENVKQEVMPGTLTMSSTLESIVARDINAKKVASKTQPLMRTASLDQREAFVNDLKSYTKAHPVRIFVVSSEDAPVLAETAVDLGYFTRTAPASKKREKWLVLGMDGKLVDQVADAMLNNGTPMATAGAGALVGAVAAFSTLAYA